MRCQFSQLSIVLLFVGSVVSSFAISSSLDQESRPKNSDNQTGPNLLASGTLVATGLVLPPSDFNLASDLPVSLIGPDSEVLAHLVLPFGADIPSDEAQLVLQPTADALDPTQVTFQIQGQLPAAWTTRPAESPSAVPGGYAGNQADRSWASWSGNGASADFGTGQWTSFSGKPGSNVSAASSNSALVPEATVKIQARVAAMASRTTFPFSTSPEGLTPSAGATITALANPGELRLSWPALAGQVYEVLASRDVSGPYEVVQTIATSATAPVFVAVPFANTTSFFKVRLRSP